MCIFVLRTGKPITFETNVVGFPVRNANIYTICKLRKVPILQHFASKHCNFATSHKNFVLNDISSRTTLTSFPQFDLRIPHRIPIKTQDPVRNTKVNNNNNEETGNLYIHSGF